MTNRCRLFQLLLSLLLLHFASTTTSNGEVKLYDVLVYGANAAGVGAAVTASENGKYKVKVVEPLKMIGGMAAAGGVALMNQGGCGLTGLSKNWSMIVGKYYGLDDGMPYPPFPRMKESELAFWSLLNSSSTIEVSVGCRVIGVASPQSGASPRPRCIGQVDFLCDDERRLSIKATYIIDASYDGDIMTMSGVDHTSGREPRSKYNESLAGVQVKEWSGLESFALQNISISPFYKNGTLLKYIDPKPLPPDGSGDDKLMAFQYFVCLSTTKGNRVEFYPPEGYDPDDFTLLLRQTNAVMANGRYPEGPPFNYFGDVQYYDQVVENTTGNKDGLYCCGPAPVDSDQPGLNRGWATSDFETRQIMANDHRYYSLGSLYFMANDPRMPNYTRQDANRFGYCKDEYSEHGHFPPQLYVRISNRLIGQQLLTQNNMVNPRIKPDGVAMGCWPFDQHTMSRHWVVVPDPKNETRRIKVVRNEGFFRAELGRRGLSCDHPDAECDSSEEGFGFYDVPFGVMVPAKASEASNLLIPVCISASSVAYSSARIENMFMDLGSAAGVAVAELLNSGASLQPGKCPKIAVQSVNISAVQHVLSTVYKQRFHGPPLWKMQKSNTTGRERSSS